MSEPGSVIVELRAENFKRLQVVRIRPDGSPLVVVGGDNGEGKSSVLDAIMATLGGRKACPEEPIRKGAKRAEVEVDIGAWTVRRTFTPAGGELTVKAKDGSTLAKPQDVLDALCGPIGFDPLVFAREEGKRLAMLADILGVDLAALAKQRAELYAQRREVNRRADEAAKLAAGYRRQVPEGTPAEPVSVTALVDELQDLEHENSAIRGELGKRERAAAELKRQEARVDELLIAATREQAKLATMRAAQAALEPLPELLDPEPLRARIKEVEPVNAAVARAKQAAEQERAADQHRAAADKLTAQMEALDAQRVGAIAAAHLPVEGLDIDGDAVTFNGVPFSQASSAEQLRVSVALAIAANPRLRVMLIRDGSLLDARNLALIAEMAEASGTQVWIERVGEGSETTIVMQDGEVRDV